MLSRLSPRIAAALVVVLTSTAALADTIPVYSTGNGQTTDGYVDPSWTYTLVNNTGDGPSSGTGSAVVLANNPTDFWGGWTANDGNSAWIGDNTSSASSGYLSFSSGGALSFTTTFSLAGLSPATATMSGTWTADDSGTLLLNGNVVSTIGSWSEGLIGFAAPSGDFVAGTNTLTVVIDVSDDAWEGARVDFSSATADAVPAPEPLSLLIMVVGLAGLGLVRPLRRGHATA